MRISPDPRAAVIGSGFGGLAAAIRLQASGISTVIFEQRDKPGGRAYVYEDKGFVFDAGPTVVTVPQCLEELFALAGRNMSDYVTLKPVHPFYRLFWEDGDRFDYDNDAQKLLAEIARRNPDDVEGYEAFCRYAEVVYEHGYERLGHVPFLKFWDMVRVAPRLISLNAQRSVYATVARYIKNERTRQALTFNSLLIGGNPFEVSSIYTLIHPLEKKYGVFFPEGGTHALVRGLVRLFEDLGGRIVCDAAVRRIVTREDKVVGVDLKDGAHHACDLVVSNADVHHTYATLLGESPRGKRMAKSLARRKFSMSLFVVYFGTNRRFDGLTHHNIMFGGRYRELLDDIFEKGRLADDFSLYVHAPCETDPSLAPPGHYAYYALAPVPNLEKAAIDWEVEGPRYGEKIIRYLDRHYMPGLASSIVTMRSFTPRDFRDVLNARHGNAFSLTPTLTQSAYFRVHNRDDVVRGLYFVGAGTHPGAGIPGVVGSAKATCSVIASDWRFARAAP